MALMKVSLSMMFSLTFLGTSLTSFLFSTLALAEQNSGFIYLFLRRRQGGRWDSSSSSIGVLLSEPFSCEPFLGDSARSELVSSLSDITAVISIP